MSSWFDDIIVAAEGILAARFFSAPSAFSLSPLSVPSSVPTTKSSTIVGVVSPDKMVTEFADVVVSV